MTSYDKDGKNDAEEKDETEEIAGQQAGAATRLRSSEAAVGRANDPGLRKQDDLDRRQQDIGERRRPYGPPETMDEGPDTSEEPDVPESNVDVSPAEES
ncbi:MAG: hypothetical protein ACE5Q6_15995 [Dehalococcoidia bacterium]